MSESSSMPNVPKIAHRKKARNLLVQALYQWQMAGDPVTDIEAQYRTDNSGKIDWDFFHQAFVYISSHRSEVDEAFEPLLDRDISQLNPIELAILRLGIFEFKERIDVPYKVVINEYVDLTKKYGATDSYKYVNGILDKAARTLRAVELKAN